VPFAVAPRAEPYHVERLAVILVMRLNADGIAAALAGERLEPSAPNGVPDGDVRRPLFRVGLRKDVLVLPGVAMCAGPDRRLPVRKLAAFAVVFLDLLDVFLAVLPRLRPNARLTARAIACVEVVSFSVALAADRHG